MNALPILLIAGAASAAAVATAQPEHHGMGTPPAHAPYAGQQQREIKALSAAEQRGWLEGQGMGLARAAELNGFPGPMHVLEHAQALGLTPAQVQASRALMHRHKEEARAMGQHLVARERALDALFVRGAPVDPDEVTRLAEAIGLAAGRIRAAHLRTHIEQAALLTREQVAHYQRLRGYAP